MHNKKWTMKKTLKKKIKPMIKHLGSPSEILTAGGTWGGGPPLAWQGGQIFSGGAISEFKKLIKLMVHFINIRYKSLETYGINNFHSLHLYNRTLRLRKIKQLNLKVFLMYSIQLKLCRPIKSFNCFLSFNGKFLLRVCWLKT